MNLLSVYQVVSSKDYVSQAIAMKPEVILMDEPCSLH